jgi:type II secretory pathway pseudopilin PulG
MKLRPSPLNAGGFDRESRASRAGTTLVEVMIALLIFLLVAIGIASSLIQLRKQGENTICQVLAQTVAEGLLEQIRRTSFTNLSDVTTNPPVPLLFINANSGNYASVEPFSMPCGSDATTFTDIGARTIPGDLTSAIQGVLLDVDYKNSAGTLIRPRRFMKMRANLTHSVNTNKDVVQVTLKFQWAVPDRRTAAGGLIYYETREIRTVISQMPTY